MAIVSEYNVVNQAKAYLYPCAFKDKEGKFTARFDSTKTFTVLDVCKSAVSRGGIKLRPEEMATTDGVIAKVFDSHSKTVNAVLSTQIGPGVTSAVFL
jgi:hypothetical protein